MVNKWKRSRKKPYTEAGIQRLACIRCGNPAKFQWQICSDGNNYRPLCTSCDVALNRIVLEWAGHPSVDKMMEEYTEGPRPRVISYKTPVLVPVRKTPRLKSSTCLWCGHVVWWSKNRPKKYCCPSHGEKHRDLTDIRSGR